MKVGEFSFGFEIVILRFIPTAVSYGIVVEK
jgi:hypothetical protein